MTISSDLDTGNQSAFAFGKKPLQIFILIDLMMLMVFMLLSRPENDLPGVIKIDTFKNGFVAGTKIALHDEFGYRVGAVMSHNGSLISIDENELTSRIGGVGCTSETCISSIKKSLPKDQYIFFNEVRIYFPDDIMLDAYSIIPNFCKDYQCDRNIYIRAETGEVLLCSRTNQRLYTYNKLEGGLREDERCQPARSK